MSNIKWINVHSSDSIIAFFAGSGCLRITHGLMLNVPPLVGLIFCILWFSKYLRLKSNHFFSQSPFTSYIFRRRTKLKCPKVTANPIPIHPTVDFTTSRLKPFLFHPGQDTWTWGFFLGGIYDDHMLQTQMWEIKDSVMDKQNLSK